MGKQSARYTPWLQARGFERLLAQETNISDLLEFLSDRDSAPWAKWLGFIPSKVERESRTANNADLLLVTEDGRRAVVEVKLGHVMDHKQQQGYEALGTSTDLYLAALGLDSDRLKDGSSGRWDFINLAELFEAWSEVIDEAARVLARQVLLVLREWDEKTSAVFKPQGEIGAEPLEVLTHKFLGRAVTRRIAVDLRARDWDSSAGISSGGGVPLIQAWHPIRNQNHSGCFIAEVRWHGSKPRGEFRFGVDFGRHLKGVEDEFVRRSAYCLASSMDLQIAVPALMNYLEDIDPRLAELLHLKEQSRPKAKGDWEEIVRLGFAGVPLPNGKKNGRLQTRPAFYGDGALRFQAKTEIDFGVASALDVAGLLDLTLRYLASTEPV